MKNILRFHILLFSFFVLDAFFPFSTYAEGGLDTGDIAWVSSASVLVMIMTPALGFFYAGLVRKKNLISTLVQCIAIFALVSIIWALWGYSLAFGPSIKGIVGDLSHFGLSGVGIEPNIAYASTIPALLFFFFQLKFAAITPALMIGAFAERVRFKATLLFIGLWVTLVYSPIAHWVWNPEGWLRQLGAIDFAGGTVVHISAGISALAAAIVIGKRKGLTPQTELLPNNIPFVILGASLLWFGWFGFNAGSTLSASGLAGIALVVTNLAAASGAISWMIFEWITKGKPSAVGISIGAVCGLVAITPASGYVTPLASICIGFVAGIVSSLAMNWRSTRSNVDDSLDVFACHGVSGIWGALATGIFATLSINSAGVNGALYGNISQVFIQLLAVVVVSIFSFVASYAILKGMGLFMNIRVSDESEQRGLDESEHGETAYS